MPPLSKDKLYPKEPALVDLVAAERLAGRKVLVYATHTGTRDITERMEQFLTQHGFRVAVLKADTVAPDRRETWVEERVKQGVDVVICHPRLVQTGLDLIDFPTLCWFETEFSVFQSTQKGTVLMGGRFGFYGRQRHTVDSLLRGSSLSKGAEYLAINEGLVSSSNLNLATIQCAILLRDIQGYVSEGRTNIMTQHQ